MVLRESHIYPNLILLNMLHIFTSAFIVINLLSFSAAFLDCTSSEWEGDSVVVTEKEWLACDDDELVVKNCITKRFPNGGIEYVSPDDVRNRRNEMIQSNLRLPVLVKLLKKIVDDSSDLDICDTIDTITGLGNFYYNKLKRSLRREIKALPSVCKIPTNGDGAVFSFNEKKEGGVCENNKLNNFECVIDMDYESGQTSCFYKEDAQEIFGRRIPAHKICSTIESNQQIYQKELDQLEISDCLRESSVDETEVPEEEEEDNKGVSLTEDDDVVDISDKKPWNFNLGFGGKGKNDKDFNFGLNFGNGKGSSLGKGEKEKEVEKEEENGEVSSKDDEDDSVDMLHKKPFNFNLGFGGKGKHGKNFNFGLNLGNGKGPSAGKGSSTGTGNNGGKEKTNQKPFDFQLGFGDFFNLGFGIGSDDYQSEDPSVYASAEHSINPPKSASKVQKLENKDEEKSSASKHYALNSLEIQSNNKSYPGNDTSENNTATEYNLESDTDVNFIVDGIPSDDNATVEFIDDDKNSSVESAGTNEYEKVVDLLVAPMNENFTEKSLDEKWE